MELEQWKEGCEPSKELMGAVKCQYRQLREVMGGNPDGVIRDGRLKSGQSYIFSQTQFMHDETVDGKMLTPKVGQRSEDGGFASSTMAQDPNLSRQFVPGASIIHQLELSYGGMGGYDSEDDDYVSITEETMLPCAQPRASLLTVANLTLGRTYEALEEPTMGGRLVRVKDYHASMNTTITLPIHTYPICEHCPGLLPGYHYCKETGRVVQSCEDCEISLKPILIEPATTSTPAAKLAVPMPGASTPVSEPQATTMTTLDTTTRTVTTTKHTAMRMSELNAAAEAKSAGGTGPPTTTETGAGGQPQVVLETHQFPQQTPPHPIWAHQQFPRHQVPDQLTNSYPATYWDWEDSLVTMNFST